MARFENLTTTEAKQKWEQGNPHIYICQKDKNPNHNSTPLIPFSVSISDWKERPATFEETAQKWANVLGVKIKKCEYLQYKGE